MSTILIQKRSCYRSIPRGASVPTTVLRAARIRQLKLRATRGHGPRTPMMNITEDGQPPSAMFYRSGKIARSLLVGT